MFCLVFACLLVVLAKQISLHLLSLVFPLFYLLLFCQTGTILFISFSYFGLWTSSTGRRWWMHGKSWERPTPRSAQQPVWFQHGGHRHEEPTRATFDDLPSSGALSSRGTCRRWRKRSCSPCLPRARRRRRPEDAYPPSRQWLPWGGSPPAVGQAVENFQGGSGFPGTATVRRARPTPAHG